MARIVSSVEMVEYCHPLIRPLNDFEFCQGWRERIEEPLPRYSRNIPF